MDRLPNDARALEHGDCAWLCIFIVRTQYLRLDVHEYNREMGNRHVRTLALFGLTDRWTGLLNGRITDLLSPARAAILFGKIRGANGHGAGVKIYPLLYCSCYMIGYQCYICRWEPHAAVR